MIHEYYKELQNNQNIRENLSLLRSECKDPQARETLLSLVGDGALLTGLLESDEPKVRKNAALLGFYRRQVLFFMHTRESRRCS